MTTTPVTTFKYDKGERRFKHVGKGPEPEIEFDDGDPKKWVGKCPDTLSIVDCERLINEALRGSNGDREGDLGYAKKLYAVHEGVIYEAQTSDQGKSYHGYPYRGKLSRTMLMKLREISQKKNCEEIFSDWIKKHITVHGSHQ